MCICTNCAFSTQSFKCHILNGGSKESDKKMPTWFSDCWAWTSAFKTSCHVTHCFLFAYRSWQCHPSCRANTFLVVNMMCNAIAWVGVTTPDHCVITLLENWVVICEGWVAMLFKWGQKLNLVKKCCSKISVICVVCQYYEHFKGFFKEITDILLI